MTPPRGVTQWCRAPRVLAARPEARSAWELRNTAERRYEGKGFGRALGPSASARLVQLGDTLGFSVGLAQSDWRLDSDETDLQVALTQGWTAAALEQAAALPRPEAMALMELIRQWQQVRCAQIAANGSRLRVGHQDALLLPR